MLETQTFKSNFISQVERHFVRTFLPKERRTDTEAFALQDPQVSVCRIDGQKTFKVDRAWFQDLRQRVDFLTTEGVSTQVLVAVDFKEAIATASEVVLTLWSAFRSHWGFEYDRNLFQLIESALWYVPMCGPEQSFIPFLKYQLSYLFAKGERQEELPERPNWMNHKDGLVLVGTLGRAFYKRALGLKESSREWRNTILHGIKKGLPQMGSFHLLKNLKAMKTRLTRESRTPSCLQDEIQRTTREIFPKGLIFDDWSGGSMFTKISDHACWESSRSQRGPLGVLRTLDMGNGSFDWTKRSKVFRLQPDQLLGMFYDPHLNEVHELRIPAWTPESIYSQLQRFSSLGETGKTFFESEGLEPTFFDLKKDSFGCAKVKPIFEPLKVRMISAGDILSNGLFSKLQQKLWQGLQRFPQFRLTGQSVTSSDIREIHDLTNQTLGDYHLSKWVSGDYSAATDNLNGDASRVAVQACSGDPITSSVLLRGLQNTLISFESIRETFEDEGDLESAAAVPDPFVMTNGQLMGCVFSFPILCIVNIAVYRASLEAYSGKRFALRDLPVLVNGDDILFKTNDDHYQIWTGLIPKVGFEKSVGKNYVSKDFCVINSQYFETESFRKVPYFNLGWCTGVTKGSGGRFEEGEDGEERTILGLKAKIEKTKSDWISDPDFVSGLTPKHNEKRNSMFFRYREEVRRWNWDRITKTAVSIGPGPAGLGLTDEMDLKEFAWAHYLYLNRDDRGVSHGLDSVPKSMVPWKITKCDSPPSTFWDVRKRFERTIKELKLSPEKALWKFANEFYERILDQVEVDVLWKPRYSVGAL